MIYLDNHATTPCDKRVAAQMPGWLTDRFGNPHSTSHGAGREAKAAIDEAAIEIAQRLGTDQDGILFTSGATESNNLAIDGFCRHPRQKRRHVITSEIEHPAVLDVVLRLEKDGFRVTRLPVIPSGHDNAGRVDLEQFESLIDDDTALVSIHWANNEIGVIQPMQQIASIAHRYGAIMHSDATQAVGRLPLNLKEADVDLVSASAHKFYGPKGVGLLTVGCGNRRVRIKPMIVGGGQQRNLRSGTMAPANIVALAMALRLSLDELPETVSRVGRLRDLLWESLRKEIEGLELNGPSLQREFRLAGNLNCMLPGVEGEAWMSACPEVAFSSGSACSSVDSKPSHVLLGLGLAEGQARRSVRFGIGKFNTEEEIIRATEFLGSAYRRLST